MQLFYKQGLSSLLPGVTATTRGSTDGTGMWARGGHWGAVLEGDFRPLKNSRYPSRYLLISLQIHCCWEDQQLTGVLGFEWWCLPVILAYAHGFISYFPVLTSLLLPFFLLVCLLPSFLPCFLPCFFFLHSLSFSLWTFYFIIFQKTFFSTYCVLGTLLGSGHHCWSSSSFPHPFFLYQTSLSTKFIFLSIRYSASL